MPTTPEQRRALRAKRVRRRRRVFLLSVLLVIGLVAALVSRGGGGNASATTVGGAPGAGKRLAAASTPAATTTTTTTTTEPPVRRFSLVAGGDIALSGSGATSSTFAGIERYLHGDIVFGNQEGTLATGGSPKCAPYGANGCFTFRADPSSAAELRRAGFTVMNVANNHALDYGPSAQQETLAALRGAGIASTGLPGQITVVDAGGVKVALIGCAPYPWAQSLLAIDRTAALVRRATKLADVVLVYMHAGAEGSSADHVPNGEETFLGEDRGNPRAFAHAMIDAGAALVFASGPHTLRGLEWYHGHLVAYSLGNFAGSNTLSVSGSLSVSALLSLDLDSRGRFVSGSVIPLQLVGAGTPEPDPNDTAISTIRTLSEDDFASHPTIQPDGTIVAPAAAATDRGKR